MREHIDSWSKPLDITVILVNESMFSQTSVRIIFSVFSFLLIGRHDYFGFGDNQSKALLHSFNHNLKVSVLRHKTKLTQRTFNLLRLRSTSPSWSALEQPVTLFVTQVTRLVFF